MPDTDTVQKPVTTSVRKPRTRTTAPKTKFVPYTAEGDKEMMDAPGQEHFIGIWQGLSQPQKDAVIKVLNSICENSPIFSNGYKKFFRFWRKARVDLQSNIKF